jgi:hypothetical protein
MPKQRRARKAVLTVALAAGISSALVLGQATNSSLLVQLTNTVIGIGGRDDSTSIRVPDKLSGTVRPASYSYQGINYPASLMLSDSARDGLPKLHDAITSRPREPYLIVAGYSEGTLVAELERRRLQALNPSDAPSKYQLSFVMIASPFAPNGGIFGRFPGISIPVIVDGMGPGLPTRYDTLYVANEYDPYADFPAYFNPLALLNSLLAVQYSHPDQYYDAINPGTTPASVTVVHNSAGGYDTYMLVHSQYLPLLGPLRQAASAVFLTPFTEPVLSAFEPLLRILVDMSYTDRLNLDPATPTPFSLITPPGKILEALGAVPGALAEGLANLLSGGQLAIAPTNQKVNALSAASIPAADSGGTAALRLAAVPEPEAEPKLKVEPEATIPGTPPKASSGSTTETAAPTASSTASSTASTSTASTPTASTSTANSPGDRLHPTVTSDGNKVTPGGATVTSPTGSGTTTPTTGTTTTTTTIGTTTTTTTTGTTAGEASDDTESEDAAAA